MAYLFCNRHNRFIKDHLNKLGKAIQFYLKTYENLIMGHFNAEIFKPKLVSACTFYNFKCFINKLTFYKNPDNPSCIDLNLPNCPYYFQDPSTFETGSSDFQKLILTLFKSEILRQQPNIISYRKYKRFHSLAFESVIAKKLEKNM